MVDWCTYSFFFHRCVVVLVLVVLFNGACRSYAPRQNRRELGFNFFEVICLRREPTCYVPELTNNSCQTEKDLSNMRDVAFHRMLSFHVR